MRNTGGKMAALALLVSAGAVSFAACGDNKEGPATGDADVTGDADAQDGPTVARGSYIMNVLGACTFCHTPLNPDGSRNTAELFAGWSCDPAEDPIPFFDADPATDGFGCLNTRNLTPSATGIMNITDAQLRDAIRNGNRSDGKTIVPVMPYWLFHNLTDDDVDSVIMYMRTLAPVDKLIPANEEPWLAINNNDTTSPLCMNTAGGAPATCTATPIDPADIPLPAAGTADMESAMRGRYLAGMSGLCIDCHTPDFPPPGPGAFPPLFPTPIDTSRSFAGGRAFPKENLGLVDPSVMYPAIIITRNLTPHSTGLMDWSREQLEDAIARGKDREGDAVCAATHGSMISPYAALDPQDLTDIANYLQSLGGVDNDTGADCKGPPVP